MMGEEIIVNTPSFLMNSLFELAFFAVSLLVLLTIVRIIKGPHIADRLVGFGTTNTLVVTLLVLIGAFFNSVIYIDVAIVYGMLSFVGTLFIAKYMEGSI